MPAYEAAYNANHSTIVCEIADFLNEDFRISHAKLRETCNV
jgi:hypothetical protein